MNIVSSLDVADVVSHSELVPNADLNAWCWQAIDCPEGEPKALQVALVSVSKEMAAKFKDAFEMARLISQATDGENSGGDQVVAPVPTDHG